VIPLIKSDLVDLFLGVANNNLDQKELTVLPYASATIVLASGGYPEILKEEK
jgi:phosphoribosylamine--glycine ligase